MTTRTGDSIRLSNGDVMTLGEALDRGLVEIRQGETKRGGPCWTAWEVGAEVGWDVHESLFRHRKGLPFRAAKLPDDAPIGDIARAVLECSRAWEPETRLLGNVRAAHIAKLAEWVARESAK